VPYRRHRDTGTPPAEEEFTVVLRVLLVLLALWLVLSVIGMVVEGLFWLAVVGIGFFVGTAVVAALNRRSGSGPPVRRR
jgi:hypothetical protein